MIKKTTPDLERAAHQAAKQKAGAYMPQSVLASKSQEARIALYERWLNDPARVHPRVAAFCRRIFNNALAEVFVARELGVPYMSAKLGKLPLGISVVDVNEKGQRRERKIRVVSTTNRGNLEFTGDMAMAGQNAFVLVDITYDGLEIAGWLNSADTQLKAKRTFRQEKYDDRPRETFYVDRSLLADPRLLMLEYSPKKREEKETQQALFANNAFRPRHDDEQTRMRS